jgi:hypothetical protein
MIEGYLPREERKKILLLCDDIRMHSGIATMAREIVVGTAHRFNWIQIGAALQHPDNGKLFDLSADINNKQGIPDALVKVLANNGYGDAQLVRSLIASEKPDAIFIFTDPRYWEWLFELEREIRNSIPIFYLNIWDDYPAPYYNETFYNSVDLLMAISKQTKNINEIVLGDNAKNKLIKYVPHGIDENVFLPIKETDIIENFKKELFGDKEIEFVVFFNSRNIQRKHPGDSILAYKYFCDLIGKEKAKKCAFVLHTAIVDQHGTDLRAVKETLTDPEYVNIYFSTAKLSPQQMNLMYNISDVTMLLSSNEGWGLSLTESMMAGTMILANVTGGMQDQMRFVNSEGKWIDFTPDFPSNHRGTYKDCGEWAVPIFPSNISLAGSPTTPYIFDDRVQPEDAAIGLEKVYNLGKEEIQRRGLKGREFVTSSEAQMSAKNMCSNVINCMEESFDSFIPRSKYDLIKVENLEPKRIQHKLTGY